MKKRQMVTLFVIILLIATVMGCVSGTNTTGGTAQQNRPLGKYGVPMPDWAMGKVPPETGDAMYFRAQGGKGSSMEQTFQALSVANGLVAGYISMKTDMLIKNYSERSGEGENTQSLQSLRTLIINRATANTKGVRMVEDWLASDGEYHALYAYDKVIFSGDIIAETNTFVRNRSAAYANSQADKFEENMREAKEETLKVTE